MKIRFADVEVRRFFNLKNKHKKRRLSFLAPFSHADNTWNYFARLIATVADCPLATVTIVFGAFSFSFHTPTS